MIVHQSVKGNMVENFLEQLGRQCHQLLIIKAKAAEHQLQRNLCGGLLPLCCTLNSCEKGKEEEEEEVEEVQSRKVEEEEEKKVGDFSE